MNELKRDCQVQVWRWHSRILRTGVILAVSVLTFPDAWALDAAPTMLSFQTVQGSTSPSTQIVNILKTNPHTVSWSSSKNVLWLGLSPTTGNITTSAQISVSVNPTGLAVGTYTGTIKVSATKGGNISVPVTLTVTPGTSSTSPILSSSSATTATLTWQPSTSTDVASYKVYMGTASGVYSSSIPVGNVTAYTVTNLGVGSTYYFAVTASNISGLESSHSSEVSKSVY
jgi:Fibronectin type III domain